MNVFLWILQIALAGMFAMAGVMKSTQPREKLLANMPWVEDFSAATVKFIGVVELLAAIGLIVPAATGIATVLTPLAASGLAVVMVLATITHLRRKEAKVIPVNLVLLVVAVLIAWGRFGPYSF
jgi:uncharacterized membrane protein YphA (DoxX/SURF4 family)